MPVYTVRWNPLHTRTFLSCGADWALKVWDESKPKKVTSAAK
jgi:dynein intermediate chain 1, axonemal